jgi:hypothetical protein
LALRVGCARALARSVWAFCGLPESLGMKADCGGTGHGAPLRWGFSLWEGGGSLLSFCEEASHPRGILVGDYLLGGRTTNNQLRTGTDKGNPTV